MPSALSVVAEQADVVAAPKICQMVPTTFHGISSGSAISTRQTGTPQPFFGMVSAMKMPSGTSIARMMKEKIRLRDSSAS